MVPQGTYLRVERPVLQYSNLVQLRKIPDLLDNLEIICSVKLVHLMCMESVHKVGEQCVKVNLDSVDGGAEVVGSRRRDVCYLAEEKDDTSSQHQLTSPLETPSCPHTTHSDPKTV